MPEDRPGCRGRGVRSAAAGPVSRFLSVCGALGLGALIGLGGLAGLDAGCSKGGAPERPDKTKRDLADPDDPFDPNDPNDPTDPNHPPDLSGSPVDLRGALPDLLGPSDLRPPPDLSSMGPPCKYRPGSGWAAFRFSFSGSTSARLEAIGLPDKTFSASAVRATSYTDELHGGGIELGSGNWLLILYSFAGLTHVNSATLAVYGRSYSTGSSGSFEAWSPAGPSISSPVNSVSNAWPYTWTAIDFTPIADPTLMPYGIRLYPRGSSSNLVISTVELCIDGW